MIWHAKESAPSSFKTQFPEFHPFLCDLLWQRGLRDQVLIDEFFNPDYETDLHDPYLMPAMSEAVACLLKAIEEKEKVAIFGDYDVDGVSSTVLLASVLEKAGLKVSIYLPDRAKEGYGLNMKGIDEVHAQGAKLLISVDCGMTDVEETKYAKKLGMNVMIVDHHQPLAVLPSAEIIVNPHLHNSQYPFKELAATGVVFKLVQALVSKLRQQSDEEIFPAGYEKWFLDLVALATVADSMPLKGENRTLLHYGLLVLAQTKRVGLKALMEVAGVKPILRMQSPGAEDSELSSALDQRSKRKQETNLNPQTIAFALAPRINAASRMDHANASYELLRTEDLVVAQTLANGLNQKNRERFLVVKKIIEEIAVNPDVTGQSVVLVGRPDWPIGVLGIVAGKIVEEMERPVFIYQDLGGDSAGSARSVNGFNLVEAMQSCSAHLKEFGGHKAAAGFHFDSKNVKELHACLVKSFHAMTNEQTEAQEPVLDIDLEIRPEDFSTDLYDVFKKMEPFGHGNPVPKLLLKNCVIKERKTVGKDSQHSKLKLVSEDAKKEISALAFNQVLSGHLSVGQKVNVVGEILPDDYNGTINISLKIIDIQPVF